MLDTLQLYTPLSLQFTAEATRARMHRAERQYHTFSIRAEQMWADRDAAIEFGAPYYSTSYMADEAEGLEALARLALAKFDNAKADLEILEPKGK